MVVIINVVLMMGGGGALTPKSGTNEIDKFRINYVFCYQNV